MIIADLLAHGHNESLSPVAVFRLNSAEDSAYPITSLSLILIPEHNKGLEGDHAALSDYISYALTTGQHVAEELNYAKLPAPVQHQGHALLSQLTQNAQPFK